MTMLPDKVREAWEERQAPSIFATVSADGMPNAIYVTCIGLFGDDRIVIADNFFSKTRANILAGSRGAVLFRSKEGTQYQVKGSLEYHTEGEIFEDMKRWNLPDKPGHAAAALHIEEVYSGAERLA
jgi:uncharacterized protein